MTSNHIQLKPVVELLNQHFFIPSYQRGYRWTELEVTALLNDIKEFEGRDRAHGEIYCLQPVVVKAKNGKWEVIDGQQRLTTIFIILTYINKNIFRNDSSVFELSFETRPNSETFLKNIDRNKRDENIDYYHICVAWDTVEKWFNQFAVAQLIATKIFPVLLEQVQVIWYEIKDHTDPIAIFTRINVGKIPLTNAELIKALLLSENNFPGNTDKTNIHLKQLEIAGEWDRMEYRLRNEAFWYFLHSPSIMLENRIAFLFNMIADNRNSLLPQADKVVKERNDYFSFSVFNKWTELEKKKPGKSDIEIVTLIWQEVKDYFQTFDDWFSDPQLYHLVGYLLCVDEKLVELKHQCRIRTKSGFKEYLHQKIRSRLSFQLKDLSFGDRRVRELLLFFNIKTLLDNQSNTMFPFDKYKTDSWDIEHIHSVAAEMPRTKRHQEDWLNDIKDYTNDAVLSGEIITYLNQYQNKPFPDFETRYYKILKQVSEAGDTHDVNDLSNLALLDSGTNRGYKNAIFPVKRKKIIEKDKGGKFIPVCTKNVFLKYYSPSPDTLTIWKKDDRMQYLESIKTSLKNFLPHQNS